jgi:Putative beta-barrel porin 2
VGFYNQFNQKFHNEQRRVIDRPAVPEQTVLVTIPGIPGQPRSASVVTGLNGSWDVQWVKSRSALTFDLNAGVEYYWNRPGTAADYTGGLSFAYVRRMNSRMQFSANASTSYQSQPDYSRVNLQQQGIGNGQSNGQGSGSYLAANTKYDLSYRWGRRFHTDTSFSLNTVFYADSQRKGNNFWEAVLGNEFQYLYSSRVSLIGELRYGITRYFQPGGTGLSRDSNTVYLLVGTDYRLSRRAGFTFRVGESARSYVQGAASSGLTPHAEGTISYQYSSRTGYTLNGRYGFEEATNPGDQNTVARLGLSATHAFTPRLSSSLGVNLIHNSEQSASANTANVRKVYDASASMSYRFNRHFTMSTRLNYTINSTSFSLPGSMNFEHPHRIVVKKRLSTLAESAVNGLLTPLFSQNQKIPTDSHGRY